MVSTIIIGGGITGLVSAYRSFRRGEAVTLIEPNQLGGLVQTLYKDGFTLEQGPNVLVEKDDLLELLSDLKLTQNIVRSKFDRYRQLVWFKGCSRRVPRSLFQLLFTRLISCGDKCKIIRNIFAREIGITTSNDETIQDLFSRIFGEAAVKNILDPALQGIFGGDVLRLSARSIFPDLWRSLQAGSSIWEFGRGRKKRAIFVLRGGMHSLVRTLSEELDGKIQIINDNVVTVRSSGPNNFEVETTGGARFSSERVVVTTSGFASAEFIKPLDDRLAGALSEVRYAPLVVVHVSVPESAPQPRRAFGVLFPSKQGLSLLGVMFNSILFPHVAPRGKHLLTVCLGGIHVPNICEQTDLAICEKVKVELETKFFQKDMEILAVQRWPRAIPQYEIGHFELEKLMSECEGSFPGLTLCGADRGGIGVPDRVKMACAGSSLNLEAAVGSAAVSRLND